MIMIPKHFSLKTHFFSAPAFPSLLSRSRSRCRSFLTASLSASSLSLGAEVSQLRLFIIFAWQIFYFSTSLSCEKMMTEKKEKQIVHCFYLLCFVFVFFYKRFQNISMCYFMLFNMKCCC